MLISFENLNDQSKLWIFPSKQILEKHTKENLSLEIEGFINNWLSHGEPVQASYQILHDRFIVISGDVSGNHPSGCSIDNLLNTIKLLNQKYNLNLLDYSYLTYSNQVPQIKFIDFSKIKEAIAQNYIAPNSLIFDNSLDTLGKFKTHWMIKAKNSWLKKYFIA